MVFMVVVSCGSSSGGCHRADGGGGNCGHGGHDGNSN